MWMPIIIMATAAVVIPAREIELETENVNIIIIDQEKGHHLQSHRAVTRIVIRRHIAVADTKKHATRNWMR